MKLRSLAITSAAAVVFALSAGTASAVGDESTDNGYPPPEYCAISANPSRLVAGGTTTVTVVDKPNTSTKLTVTSTTAGVEDSDIEIAGSQTAVKTTDAAGNATFTVTLSAVGGYTLDATMNDERVCALSVTVTGGILDEEDEESDSDNDTALLALTGVDTGTYLGAAAVIAAAGAAAIALSRRRKHS